MSPFSTESSYTIIFILYTTPPMYRNMHPATTDVLNFVLHMNNGIIEASLKPHIGDMDSDGAASPHGEDQIRMWDSAHGVVLIPAMSSLERRPSGESSGSSATPESASIEDPGHLNSPELAASLKTLPLNVSDAATGHIYLEPEAAAQSARVFARNHAFEESSPRGWTLVRKSSIFTPASIRSGIELRIDIRDSFTTSAVWDGHTSIRFDVIDMGVTQSDSIAARRAPVLVPQELADQDIGAEPKSWQTGLANYTNDEGKQRLLQPVDTVETRSFRVPAAIWLQLRPSPSQFGVRVVTPESVEFLASMLNAPTECRG